MFSAVIRPFVRSGWAALVATACTSEPRHTADTAVTTEAAATSGSPPRAIPTIAEQLRAFQAGAEPVDTLADGAASRDDLVRVLVDAIGRRDTSEVRRRHLSRAEYAYLYYPSAEIAKPPYELDPETAWFLLTAESDKGIRRALDRLGGQPLHYVGHRCDTGPKLEGRNRVWRSCLVRLRVAGARTDSLPLFGAIVERDGRFKFVNYWNKM